MADLIYNPAKVTKEWVRLNCTYREFALRSGIPVATMHKIIQGRTRVPRLSTLDQVAKAMGLESALSFFDLNVSQTIHETPPPPQ